LVLGWQALSQKRKEFFGHDVTNAGFSATTAQVFPIKFKIVPVVKGNLFAGADLSGGDYPDPILKKLRLTVWFAVMIDEAGGIPFHVAIQIGLIVQGEDILVVGVTSLQRLPFGDAFSAIFHNALSRRNIGERKKPKAVDAGCLC
jgi:hypothetical protein